MPSEHPAVLAKVLDLMLDAVCIVDPQGRFVYVSAAFERIFGYAPHEVIGRPMIELVHPDDRARTLNAVDEIVANVHKPNFENRYVRKDGQIAHIMWTARWSPADQVRVAVARDVTGRKRAESMQAALYAISEAVYAAEDLEALYRRIHGIVAGLLPAATFEVTLYDRARDLFSRPYRAGGGYEAGAGNGDFGAAVARSGQALWMGDGPAEASPDAGGGGLGVPLVSHAGVIGALVVESDTAETRYTAADIELLKFVSTQVALAIERKQAETRLQHIAGHDALTDLPNRSLFGDRLTAALARARRDGIRLAVLYLDLDDFKDVNDRFGHAAGDLLLQQVAQRLKRCVRESDTVGRIGGDEFVVLLGRIGSPDDAAGVAEKIRQALCEPFELAGCTLQMSPSIGIAAWPGTADSGEALLQRADAAMYAAKQRGGNRFERSDGA